MKKKFLILSMGFLLLLSGCAAEKTPAAPSGGESEIVKEENSNKPAVKCEKTLEAYNIPVKEAGSCEAEVSEYDFGEMEYTSISGKKMPFRLRGVIGIPKGEGTYPLVLITHGSHANEEEGRRFDTGFTYLAEALAKSGYVAVSMDMQSAYLWKYGDNDDKEKSIYIANKHLECLKEANEGNGKGVFSGLKSKIDFSNVALMGHSRGGDTVFDIAAKQQEAGVGITAILSVAPAVPADILTKEWPEASVSVLVPEYDGDVVSLDGFYMNAVFSEKIKRMHALTYLRRANHNYFNTELRDNDALLARGEDELQDQISREEQQAFLVQYTVDFMEAAMGGRKEETLYDWNSPLPNQMYGLDVMNTRGTGEDSILFTPSEREQLTAKDCNVSKVQDSWYFGKDEVIIDTLTYGNEEYQTKELLQIQWEKEGAEISMLPKTGDFSGHSTLSFAMVTDPESSLNEKWGSQRFTVVLKDKKGNTSALTLQENLNTLSKTPGFLDMTPIEDRDYQFWSRPSPITEIAIPLTEFDGVELKNIETVELRFDQTESGMVYLFNVTLQ